MSIPNMYISIRRIKSSCRYRSTHPSVLLQYNIETKSEFPSIKYLEEAKELILQSLKYNTQAKRIGIPFFPS